MSSEQDIEYSWKCNPSEDKCEDTNDVTPMGYSILFVLMVVFLFKDLIDGLKMVILSGKKRHSHSLRARFFIAGIIVCSVTMVRFLRDLPNLLHVSLPAVIAVHHLRFRGLHYGDCQI